MNLDSSAVVNGHIIMLTLGAQSKQNFKNPQKIIFICFKLALAFLPNEPEVGGLIKQHITVYA